MGGKKKSKKNQKSKVIYVLLGLVLLLAAGAWYLYGKPTFVVDEDGLALVQTEPPLINEIKAELSAAAENLGGAGDNSSVTPAATTTGNAGENTGASDAANATNATGTSGSNPALDQGHAENSPLFWGNPSDSIADTAASKNYLMEKPQFTICYNSETLNPNWVAWHLATSDLGEADRADTFRPDTELPAGWYAVRKNDYKFTYYGFDRGHICPSADRTANTEDNSMTFLMTNMVPQAPDNNRIVWVALEKFEREQVLAGKEAYIFAGPYGKGGSGDKGYFEEIPITLKDGRELSITVPSHTWKIILFMPEGENDFERATRSGQTEIIAVNVPNEKGCGKNGSWEQYLCSVNYIEEITGYDFFELLPDDVEEEIESSVMSW
ncbi:DNA/RNA non-specific endonuclease [Treponema bryantii]|uniref:DNA/RNA non-specific endonuclease n=1 Tax=Treponema bryantii TaxID=163 RepID=UPI0003B67C11|nr:DNA/RNA non-specific endonuclease [Treponema bryantii]